MTRLAKYNKDPDERKRYLIDYTDWLDTGETVSGATFDVVENTVSTPLVVDDIAVGPDTKSVQYYVSGGADNTNYEVLVQITTDLGQTKEDTVFFVIRSV